MTTRIKLRRDTAQNWLEANPILAAGEPGLETDTGKVKYGDGETAWADLPHAGGDTLTDEGSVVVRTGSTEHWMATQRREQFDTEPKSLRYDSEGNLYALTETGDGDANIAVITKYTASGAVSWQKSFTGANPVAMAVDSSDCAYITVEPDAPGVTVIKFSTAGAVLWKKEYDVGFPSFTAYIEEKSSTTLVLACAVSAETEGPNIVLVMEISGTDGSVQIKKQIAFDGLDQLVRPTGIDVDSDENVFVTGYYYDTNDSKNKMFIEKLDEDLDRVWTKSLETDSTYSMYGGDCASDAQGNIYVIGSYSVDTVNSDGTTDQTAGILAKLNSSGVVQWTRRIGPGPCGSFIAGLTATDVGDVYLSAVTFAKNTDNVLTGGNEFLQEVRGVNKMIVARIDTQGAAVWQRYVDVRNLYEYWDGEDNRGQAIAVFGDKFAVDGYGQSWNTTPWNFSDNADEENDYFVVQLPTDGTELTIGNLDFVESRIPARFVTHTASTSPLAIATYTETVLAETSELTTDAESRVANNIVKSETYDYVFGADGTLTIPNDGDVRLTQTQVGYLIAIGGGENNDDDINSRATCVDSQGNMYVGGEEQDDYEPFITKISPDGVRQWGVTINEDSGDEGRVNGMKIDPATGNLVVLCEMYGNYTYTTVITLDQDTGRILSNETFNDADSDVYLNDIAYTSTGTRVLAGSKYGEFSANIAVTAQTGSTTGTIIVLRSETTAAGEPYNWQIGGTGITPFENVAYVERYTVLTGTVRQGTGATFNIELSQPSTTELQVVDLSGAAVGGSGTLVGDTYTTTTGGDYITFSGNSALRDAVAAVTGGGNDTIQASWSTGSTSESTWVYVQIVNATDFQFFTSNSSSQAIAGSWIFPVTLTGNNGGAITSVTVNAGGTNYLPGHKITIPYTAVNGNNSNADIILTVTEASGGAIQTVSSGYSGGSKGAGGTYTAVSGTNRDTGSGFTLTFESSRYSNNYSDYYNYSITNVGTNYVENDVIVIPGTSLGGTTPANDLTWTAAVSNGGVYGFNNNPQGTSQSSTWKLETTTQVDFANTGSWSITYPLSRENLLITPTWTRTFGTNVDSTDRLYAVAVDSANNIIAVGQGYGQLSENNGDDLAMVYKFNSTGTLQWARKLNETSDECYAKSVTTIGTDIYVTHESNDDGETVITKLDASGTVKWQRITDSGDDSSIARTADGNLLVAVEGYDEDREEDAIKIFMMSPSGEVVYKRWLMATTDNETRFKNGRCLAVDENSFYVTAYFDANDYNSSVAARLPVDGSGTGEYGSFSYKDVNAQGWDNFFSEPGIDNDINYEINPVDLESESNYAGPLFEGEEVYIKTTSTVTVGEGEFYINSFVPQLTTEIVRDTDGGSIVFADGSKQSTSATDIPQRTYSGQRYTLGLKDRGHHILCNTSGDDIIVPYNSRVEFPVGTVITIVNDSGGNVSIYKEGGSIQFILAGDGTYDGFDLSNYGMATLLKIGRDNWIISGNVSPD